jgi:acyl-CoA thioester hydrolase
MNIKKYEHVTQYYETDQMGIIHHSNYIRWMEEARVDLMRQAGISMTAIEERGVVIPVLTVSCEYRNMTRFGETIIVDLKLKEYNGIKMKIEYEMKEKLTGELKATGSSSHCFLSKEGKLLSIKKQYPDIDSIFESCKSINSDK